MDDSAQLTELRQQLAKLQEQTASLEQRIEDGEFRPRVRTYAGYYTAYHVLAGMVLGLIGATTSLLFNIIGSAMVRQHPLRLIQVYLTFPLGEKALTLDDGFTLAAGCCLYLGTGMIGGIPFHLILSRYFSQSTFLIRFVVATVLSIGVWLINFYVLIAQLQPLMIGGRWILDEIPVYVAVMTHLVFGWTLLLVDHWGRFVPHDLILQEKLR